MSKHVLIGTAAALMTAGAAWAGPQLESTRSTCGVINCAGMTVRGIHQLTEPFVVQIYAKEGECLRLDISEQTADLAMLVVAPSVNYLEISDDRDFDGGDLRPLLPIDQLPWTGWYTVMVSPFDVDNAVARFKLEYGRYPGGNPNCQTAAAATAQQFKRTNDKTSKVLAPVAGAAEDADRTDP